MREKSTKSEQGKKKILLKKCYTYLCDNFEHFKTQNKIKVALELVKKDFMSTAPLVAINHYTQIWNSTEEKAKDVGIDGKVHIRSQAEMPT